MASDSQFAVFVVPSGWDDRLEELAALVGGRFQLPVARALQQLGQGELVVARVDGLREASDLIEEMARMSVVADARTERVEPSASQTLHVGWNRVAGTADALPGADRTVLGQPSMLLGEGGPQTGDLPSAPAAAEPTAGVQTPPAMPAMTRDPADGAPSDEPVPAAVSPPQAGPSGNPGDEAVPAAWRAVSARERAALVRGERPARSTDPAPAPPPPVADAPPDPAQVTRVEPGRTDAATTLIMQDEAAQAVSDLRAAEPALGGWGAVLGDGLRQAAPVAAAPARPADPAFTMVAPLARGLVADPPEPGPTPGAAAAPGADAPRIPTPLDDLATASAGPARNSDKAAGQRFERLRSPAPTPVLEDYSRRPLTAALWSVLAPGAGQAFNGQQGRAVTFAIAGILVVPWLVSIRDAWTTAGEQVASRRIRDAGIGSPLSIVASFWILFGCIAGFIYSIDRATTEPQSTYVPVVVTPPPMPAPMPPPAPSAEASANPAVDTRPADEREALEERVAGLVARAQLACNQNEFVACRELSEQALALDETNPAARRVNVQAIHGLSPSDLQPADAARPNEGSTPIPPGLPR